jgi:hypothetical protein
MLSCLCPNVNSHLESLDTPNCKETQAGLNPKPALTTSRRPSNQAQPFKGPMSALMTQSKETAS